jgi:hypothetical protein
VKTSYVLVFLLFTRYSFCQLNESFSDGDFTNNPVWQGDLSYFKVNSSFSLQSQGPAANGNIQLFTESSMLVSAQWEFFVRMDFEPSASNYCKVYISSDSPDLRSNLNGYYLKIGGESGTTDKIELFRQNGTSSTKLISGIPGNVGKNFNKVRIKVTRDYSGNWSVFSDTSGAYNYSFEGSAIDNSIQSGAYFGVVCIHSSTRKDLFFFDDFIIRSVPLFPTSAEAISEKILRIYFSKPIDKQTAENIENYYLQGYGSPGHAIQHSANSTDIHFSQSIPKGTYQVVLNNILASDGEGLAFNTHHFFFDPPLKYADLLITEIYADPTPSNGLPEEEFIEIYNNTGDTIDLTGYIFSDPSTNGKLAPYLILPYSYIILTSSAGYNSYKGFGNAVTVSPWPSLNNSGDHLKLMDKKGRLIFEVIYTDTWYKNSEKKEGGYSLEMVNFSDYCSSSNWKASEGFNGGTPGVQNSVYSVIKDLSPPLLLSLDILDSLHVSLKWDEELDTSSAILISCQEHFINTSFKNHSEILLNFPPERDENCLIKVENVKDCKGNLSPPIHFNLTFPQNSEAGDIIINEVLFNPRPGGVDFVEIYNRSGKVIDLKNWKLVSVKSSSAPYCILFSETFLFYPFSYLAFTSSKEGLESQYFLHYPERVRQVASFPGYNDDKGIVLLLNNEGTEIDRFDYNEDYHLKILQNKEGISLERISFWAPSNDRNNWHSASEGSGFATPGRENSQHFETSQNDLFRAEPKVFTPDQDGNKDFTLIHYTFDEPGYICNLKVYDLSGREVMRIGENYLAGKEGFWEWDGIDFTGKISPPGLYLMVLEAFHSSGKTISWKGTVIISIR